MESHHSMGCCCDTSKTDHSPKPFVTNIMREARKNQNFRTALWTGCHLQMTLMCIPVCSDIGVENHPETDQVIRVEEGQALVCMGSSKERLDSKHQLRTGDAVFLPCGTWHNIINTGNCPLKLSSIYAPPNHPRGTVHRTKADAEYKEH
ncbi:MAG: cupin domain-containing protein [Oscillospiraceae bacterium]|nr:cupin domain-containing protein [Oscillospiraceae bacterium]